MESVTKSDTTACSKPATEMQELYPKLSPNGNVDGEAAGKDTGQENNLKHRTGPVANSDPTGGKPQENNTENVKMAEEPKKCARCRRCCFACCRPCMTKYHPLSPEAGRCERMRHAFMCPPHGNVARLLAVSIAMLSIWGTLCAITGPQALPGGSLFGIVILLVCSVMAGKLVAFVRLPPLLGMLIVGGLLRNVPKINVAADIDPAWSSALRSIALVVILTRAGLGLDPVALRRLSFGVFRLAFIPCLVETVTAAVCAHLLLGFPWVWGFMLGFVLAAVSPAVVVPCMLALQEKGYGLDKGIPTLVIAAASVDDVLAISGFGIVLGMAFSGGNLALTIVKGPLEALLGIAYGIIFGIVCWYLPHKKHGDRTLFQFVILLFGGLFAQFGSRAADLSGAGALGCLSLAFVAALNWRKDVPEGQDPKVSPAFAYLWTIFQPLLFGLIGAEIDISTIQAKTIGLGVAVLCIGLLFRVVASFLSVFRLGMNLREKLFIPLAWLPKATVQAAIGSIALDTARERGSIYEIELGTQVLTIAVLVILITAPIGAIAMSLSAPRLLSKRASPASSPVHQSANADPDYSKYEQVLQV